MADALVIANRLHRASVQVPVHMKHFMTLACTIYMKSAQTAIGTYRFGWKQLAPSTIRAHGGANTPLLVSGALRNSINFKVGHMQADVGTSHYVARWQEGGTRTIPPRPFMGGALKSEHSKIEREIHHMLDRLFRP